jgi:hypothetical protein
MLDPFLSEAAQDFKVFQKLITEIKIKAVDVLFKAYPMVTLSCKSNLAGRYL